MGGGDEGCTEIDECADEPCANGGTCTDRLSAFECACAQGWSGETCTENAENKKVDSTVGVASGISVAVVIIIIVIVAVVVVVRAKNKKRNAVTPSNTPRTPHDEDDDVVVTMHNTDVP